jgi:hypothetical protein
LSGCHLYLFGGKDPLKGSMRRVVYYSARTNKWHRAPNMQRKRHFFGFCVINNCLYVAGGECEGVQRSLRSAEMYDPNRNKWCSISDMSTAMVPFIGVVYGGRLASYPYQKYFFATPVFMHLLYTFHPQKAMPLHTEVSSCVFSRQCIMLGLKSLNTPAFSCSCATLWEIL